MTSAAAGAGRASSAFATSSMLVQPPGRSGQRRPQRRLEVAHERRLVGVPGLGPVPAHRDGRLGGEPRQERRLARPGRRDDERQPVAPRVERGAPRAARGAGRPETAPGSSRVPRAARRHAPCAALSRAGRCPSRNRRPPPSSPPSAGPDYGAPRWRIGSTPVDPFRDRSDGPVTSSRAAVSMRRRRRTRRSAAPVAASTITIIEPLSPRVSAMSFESGDHVGSLTSVSNVADLRACRCRRRWRRTAASARSRCPGG